MNKRKTSNGGSVDPNATRSRLSVYERAVVLAEESHVADRETIEFLRACLGSKDSLTRMYAVRAAAVSRRRWEALRPFVTRLLRAEQDELALSEAVETVGGWAGAKQPWSWWRRWTSHESPIVRCAAYDAAGDCRRAGMLAKLQEWSVDEQDELVLVSVFGAMAERGSGAAFAVLKSLMCSARRHQARCRAANITADIVGGLSRRYRMGLDSYVRDLLKKEDAGSVRSSLKGLLQELRAKAGKK